MARTVYRVVPAGSQWQVAQNGVSLGSYLTKPPAVSYGQAVARANAPSQLVVHRADGTFEWE